jgi:N-methylhydantoinase A
MRRAATFEIEFGMPVKSPMVDIRTIGAGGGSIAWIDAGGLLRVGPQSAGSTPGPVCYGRGGTEPTLTDANLVLGRLNPHNFCGGEIPLEQDLALEAMSRLAGGLSRSVEETAAAILELANHNIVDALSVISVEQGTDPREFTLVAFGGAGPLHAADIARILGARQVLIPPYPGNTSAYGLLTAGLRSDLSTTLLIRSDDPAAVERLNRALLPLREQTVATLRREGHSGEPEFEQRLEMRYFGQNYHREIAIASNAVVGDEEFAEALQAFHSDYAQFYGYQRPEEVVEIVGLIVTASGQRVGPQAHFGTADGAAAAASSTREVFFHSAGLSETAIVQRSSIQAGSEFSGPAIVEEELSTTVVPPGANAVVHPSGSIVITLAEEA